MPLRMPCHVISLYPPRLRGIGVCPSLWHTPLWHVLSIGFTQRQGARGRLLLAPVDVALPRAKFVGPLWCVALAIVGLGAFGCVLMFAGGA